MLRLGNFYFFNLKSLNNLVDDKYKRQLSERIASLKRDMILPKYNFDTSMSRIKGQAIGVCTLSCAIQLCYN